MRQFASVFNVLFLILSVWGQDPQRRETVKEEPKWTIKVVQLRHADPSEVLGVIQQVLPAAASESGSTAGMVPPGMMGGMGTGGMGMMGPGATGGGYGGPPNAQLKNQTLRLAILPRGRSIIARGTETDIEQVVQLVNELDKPPASSSAATEDGDGGSFVVIPVDPEKTLTQSSLATLEGWCGSRGIQLVPDLVGNDRLLVYASDGGEIDRAPFEELLNQLLTVDDSKANESSGRAVIAVIAERDQIETVAGKISPALADAAKQLGFKQPAIAGQLSLAVVQVSGVSIGGSTQLGLKIDEGMPRSPASLTFKGRWGNEQYSSPLTGRLQTELKVTQPVEVGTQTVAGNRSSITDDRDVIELSSQIIAKPGRTTLIGSGSAGSQNLAFTISWVKDDLSEGP